MQLRFLYAFLFLIGSLSVEAQVKRGMTPVDVAALKSVGAAAFSEDANLIAYTVRVQSDPTVENKPARSELYL